MSKRPSKKFFYRLLLGHLPSTSGLNILDAASSRFKNRTFFPSANYVGADLDERMLERGVNMWADDNSYGYCCDLGTDELPKGCFSVAVSTHTLGHLDRKGREHFLEQLVRCLQPNGYLLFNSPRLEDKEWTTLIKKLEKNFNTVEILLYRNVFSQIYEDYMMPRRDLSRRNPVRYVHRFISVGLECLEALLQSVPLMQEGYFVVAKECTHAQSSVEFRPSSFPGRGRILYPEKKAANSDS